MPMAIQSTIALENHFYKLFNLFNPLPIDRNTLIQETRLAYGSILSSLRNGWSLSCHKRFSNFYAKRADLTSQADGVLLLQDRIIIPPTCRESMLTHLHLGHRGRDKMKSLARMLCWWPSVNEDIASFAKHCEKCNHSKPNTHPNWSPWPVTYKPMQRIHVDYCGPFLSKYYALVIEDSFSKYPDVFLTTNAFTQWALRRFFARKGVPNTIVSDNGTHFAADTLQTWLKSIRCHSLFTAPRHPTSFLFLLEEMNFLHISCRAPQFSEANMCWLRTRFWSGIFGQSASISVCQVETCIGRVNPYYLLFYECIA